MRIYLHPLQSWVEKNMPELDAELAALPSFNDCRARLNEVTGFRFLPSDLLHKSMDAYLAKLKEMKK